MAWKIRKFKLGQNFLKNLALNPSPPGEDEFLSLLRDFFSSCIVIGCSSSFLISMGTCGIVGTTYTIGPSIGPTVRNLWRHASVTRENSRWRTRSNSNSYAYMMGLPQLVQIISKILKTVRDDYIFRASPSEMIYSFKNMPNLKNYFVWWEDPGRAE